MSVLFDKAVELKRSVGAFSHVMESGIPHLATNWRNAFRKSTVVLLSNISR